MGRKKKEEMEFRYYDIPQKEYVLALLGDEWIRDYGKENRHLHFHNLMEIGYCKNGHGHMILNDRMNPYEASMISIIPKNYPHTTNSEEGEKSHWEYLFFDPETILRAEYPDNAFLQRKLLLIINSKAFLGYIQECPQLFGIALSIMEEMRYKKEFYIDTVKALVTALLFEIARLNNTKSEQICINKNTGITQLSNALNYISTAYRGPIKIEVLADKCNMSETHFRRLFTEYMNMTPVEYINLVRIQNACEYMKRTNASMSEIAVKSGFDTISTFNRNFKKIVGATPYQWKKNPENYESKLLQFHISAEKGW